ncbi:hypothetical protein CALVIDRAFT_565513 [Calocera viscosa TUFC12733]|uniref:AttH domain-containing protein n=1 Tax=Calocera viscosa (strain TUFC12733) TaxID=1330018 RepID=A0A167KLU0_CALVF|nr:hypothetical protein CALVIDRAFT_565513 [Calocera viscosa TUFC12733]
MAALLVLFGLLLNAQAQTTIFPPYAQSGTPTIEWTLGLGSFDGPKMNFFNTNSAQWWYFDVVSNDLTESIVITFLGNAPGATETPASEVPFNFIEVNLQLSNGSLAALLVPSQSIIMTTIGDGSSAVFNGSGYSWTGTPNVTVYTINIDDTVNDLSGSITFNTAAYRHASCGPDIIGGTLLVVANLGWANAIPDSVATVSLTYQGQQISYQGRGYHDSNWGNQSFAADLGSWYWGHATFGPWSLVWWDMMDVNGNEHQLGYASYNGQIISNTCAGISVRPTGANSAYPPVAGLLPSGFYIVYDLGLTNGILVVNTTNTQTVVEYPGLYSRWVGSVVGGVTGETTYTGVALYEEMGV